MSMQISQEEADERHHVWLHLCQTSEAYHSSGHAAVQTASEYAHMPVTCQGGPDVDCFPL